MAAVRAAGDLRRDAECAWTECTVRAGNRAAQRQSTAVAAVEEQLNAVDAGAVGGGRIESHALDDHVASGQHAARSRVGEVEHWRRRRGREREWAECGDGLTR